jgi:hypothetical protein
MTKYKTGRWSGEEKKFIQENAQTLTVEQISKRLNRAPDSVKEKIQELGLHLKGAEAYAYDAEKDLRSSSHWRELQEQLTPEELDFFLNEWRNIVSQFRDDVYATEKIQIIDVIKVEILMNRALKQTKKTEQDIRTYQQLIADEKEKDESDRDRVSLAQWQAMVTALVGASDSLLKTYKDLLREKNGLLAKLKATREQRIEKLESSKETAAGWIRKMLLEPQRRREIGERIEKLRLAAEVELIRLSDYHTYEDGSEDRPILTPEVIKEEEEEE